MDIDSRFPYRVYATQLDNTSISVLSVSEYGAITLGECTLPGIDGASVRIPKFILDRNCGIDFDVL